MSDCNCPTFWRRYRRVAVTSNLRAKDIGSRSRQMATGARRCSAFLGKARDARRCRSDRRTLSSGQGRTAVGYCKGLIVGAANAYPPDADQQSWRSRPKGDAIKESDPLYRIENELYLDQGGAGAMRFGSQQSCTRPTLQRPQDDGVLCGQCDRPTSDSCES
jgi:hypothetical protein